MNNFPIWWDTTVTIYSKCVDTATSIITWHKSTVPNCFWKLVGNKASVGNVIVDTESITCRIPKQPNFIEPVEWVSSNSENLNGMFTLQPGDIIIKGDCDFEINEYKSGQRSTDLIAKYRKVQGCMEIKDVAIDTMTGMMNPHYKVRGL